MSTAVLKKESVLKKIEARRNEFLANLPEIGPGNPITFSPAATVNDQIWQGDLGITVHDGNIPSDYEEVDFKKTPNAEQLVPGNTEGSKHVLASLKGVKMYRPRNWNDLSLKGPILMLSAPNTIAHPTHGPVNLQANTCYETFYQVNLDLQSKIEARARD